MRKFYKNQLAQSGKTNEVEGFRERSIIWLAVVATMYGKKKWKFEDKLINKQYIGFTNFKSYLKIIFYGRCTSGPYI